MELNKFIGDRIKRYREARGMTQDMLASKLNTTRQSISRYESGERKANQDLLFELAEIFNVKVDDFFPPRNKSELNTDKEVLKTASNQYYFLDEGIAAGNVAQLSRDYTEDIDLDLIELPDSLLGKYAGDSDLFITRLNGDSMNKIIPDKSLIGVKRLCEASDYSDDDIVMFCYENGYSVKRFFNDKINSQLIFSPESTERGFHDIVVPYENASDLKLLGKVVVYVVNLD